MWLFLACAPRWEVGTFLIERDGEGLSISTSDGDVLVHDLQFRSGEGDETLEMQAGAYRVESGTTAWHPLTFGAASGHDPVRSFVLKDERDRVGEAQFSTMGETVLRVDVVTSGNRVSWDAACTGDDHFAGLGAHAMDVDHVGQAFPLWVSEPGIGKSTSEDPTADWYLTGTRHATSYPLAFLLRPEPLGLAVDTHARVDVDLCTSDRWRVDPWVGSATFYVFTGATTLDIVATHTRATGLPMDAPEWALAPWNDAVGGSERVRTVANELRAAGATTSVIWTEDWKGAEDSAFGYRLLNEWDLDTTLYPDAVELDAELEAAGFKWLAYFSPFLVEGTRAWDEASEYAVQSASGGPLTFTGASLEPTAALDLTRDDTRAWVHEKMQAALDIGFDGWMADFAEWLPPDGVLGAGDAVGDHNAYPLWWQDTNAELLEGTDTVYFTRSGWASSAGRSPVNWPGDQRTSFDADDGLPSVIPLQIGTALAGVALVGSDIAGYQSIGNSPSSKDLWFRWCTLGAFSPVMRTHHGAFAEENWQFDTDAETLAHYARYTRVHASLYPYLSSLLASARTDGTPLVLAPFLVYPEERWDRLDAYFLGPALFVAPVTAAGHTSRDISLPAGPRWYDWWTGEPATSGEWDVAIDEIPVFAPAGAIVPVFTDAPDTFVTGPLDGLRTLDDADTARTVRVFSGGTGHFVETDGTTYDAVGTGSGVATGTFASGTLVAGGLTLTIAGDAERTYTLEAYE